MASWMTLLNLPNTPLLVQLVLIITIVGLLIFHYIYVTGHIHSPRLATTEVSIAPFAGHYNETKKNINDHASVESPTSIYEKENLSCLFPFTNPFQPEILKYARLDLQTLHCRGYPEDLTYMVGNQLWVNYSKIDLDNFKYCKYMILKDSIGIETPKNKWSSGFNESVTLPPEVEFVVVQCYGKKSEHLSRSYYTLIPPSKGFPELDVVKLRKREIETAPSETLNVLMVGLDGISRNHYIRGLPKTYSFLKKNLSSFDFTMHTQNGKNTFPNSLALFAGRTEEEVSKWWNLTQYTDEFDLVLGDFDKAGFKTLYTEDAPSVGAFHYEKIGFAKPMARYNSRPICVEMEKDKKLWEININCAGNIPEIKFHFNYVSQFLETFSSVPYFAVAFLSKTTHDDMTYAKMVDEHVLNFYTSLQDKGYLNNTLLIAFSDHGPRFRETRYTFNGMIEGHAPLTVFTFPKWFLDKYPDVAKTLETNTRRLTSHFDTYATLLDLLYFRSKGTLPNLRARRGISLFQEIPKNRTCKDALIPPEFCLCGHKGMIEVNDTSSKLYKDISQQAILAVNSKRDDKLCAELSVARVLQLVKIKMDSNSAVFSSIYKIIIETTPGFAIYEVTVFHDALDFKRTKFEVGRSIERLNFYKGQTECVHDANVKAFCYCKDLVNATMTS